MRHFRTAIRREFRYAVGAICVAAGLAGHTMIAQASAGDSALPSAQPALASSSDGTALQVAAAWKNPDAASAGAAPAASPPAGNTILTGPVPRVSGPKRAVSVGKFDSIGSYTTKYGGWDIGGGLSAMMVSALVESNRFIVVERANLQQVLSEQELKAQGLVHQGSGPELGRVIGVQILIYGAVTEFGPSDKGGGFSVGVSGGGGGGLASLLSGALSRKTTSGTVALDIRLVDTTTGQIIETHRVKETISSSAWDISGGYKGISLGTDRFYATPLGQASRGAVTKAVQYIARKANDTPWTALVVEYDADELYINAGGNSGLRAGDRFQIERITKILTDPATGNVLSIRKMVLGALELTGVEPKIAFGMFVPLSDAKPERGDLVTFGVRN